MRFAFLPQVLAIGLLVRIKVAPKCHKKKKGNGSVSSAEMKGSRARHNVYLNYCCYFALPPRPSESAAFCSAPRRLVAARAAARGKHRLPRCVGRTSRSQKRRRQRQRRWLGAHAVASSRRARSASRGDGGGGGTVSDGAHVCPMPIDLSHHGAQTTDSGGKAVKGKVTEGRAVERNIRKTDCEALRTNLGLN